MALHNKSRHAAFAVSIKILAHLSESKAVVQVDVLVEAHSFVSVPPVAIVMSYVGSTE